MLDYEGKRLNEILQGKTISNIEVFDTKLLIEVEGGITLEVTDGYCKEVYTELLLKKVSYEKLPSSYTDSKEGAIYDYTNNKLIGGTSNEQD